MENRYHVCLKLIGVDSTVKVILGSFNKLEDAKKAIVEDGVDDSRVMIWDTKTKQEVAFQQL